MGQKTNIIEINGKKYDARTGDLLHASSHAAHSTPVHQPQHAPAKKVHDIVRQPAKKSGRQAQKSRTLIRHAVKKPSSVKHIKVVGHTDAIISQSAAEVVVKKPARSLDTRRVHKARHVVKSNLITHFVPVTATPAPAFQAPSLSMPLRPLAARPVAAAPHKTGGKPRTTAELLDLAIQHANSHEQPPVHHKARRKSHLKSAALSATALLVLGFVGWQQLPDIRLQLASAKAGFNVSKPAYLPVGYSLADMRYSAGSAALSFHSNSDDRQYTLTQKTSGWNNQDLLNDFVLSRSTTYQSVNSSGRDIYLYGNGNATWLSDGIWYVVQSDGALSSRQLLDLASSI